uniref:Reverse transcriptase domain-containing protein n=1 Tax=Megaselia scalaris TaxID=36166 RepID=T1GC70_MEGSC
AATCLHEGYIRLLTKLSKKLKWPPTINNSLQLRSWILKGLSIMLPPSPSGVNLCGLGEKGTPPGGILSPLVWLLVVNTIRNLSIYTALSMISNWDKSCGLAVNPSKTESLIFTKNRIPSYMDLFDDKVFSLSCHTKYLVVILDPRLSDALKPPMLAGNPSVRIVSFDNAVIRPVLMYGSIVWNC